MMLGKFITLSYLVLITVYNCDCYVHDERFVASDNLTFFEILTKNLKLSEDFIVPTIGQGEAVHDASAKFSSGLINGNVNRYGDFDECLDVLAENEDFRGQYCLAYIQPGINSDLKFLSYLRSRMLGLEAYKSELDDVHFGFCIPSSCSNKELEIVLKQNLQNFFNSSDIMMDVRVEKEMCQVKENKPYSTGTKLSLIFFASIFIISILSSFYDRSRKQNKNEWFTSFSLIKNWKELITTRASNDIESAHGVRFLCTAMIIVSHKCMEIEFNPIPNRNDLAEMSRMPLTVVVRASYLYTDAFIMLSAMLVSYSFIGRLKRGQSINAVKEIAARYFRIVPPMTALMIFGTFIFPLIGSGPQWPMLVDNQSELCKKNWWRNLLMIHNWFGFENICMTHMHHIGNDFQLFLAAPVLMTLLFKYPKKAGIGIGVLAVLSTIGRFYISYSRNMTVYVLLGIEISKLYEVASYMYIIPFYRFTVYAIGLFLGYSLRKYAEIKLTDFQLLSGWIVTSTLFIITVILTAFMSAYNYTFSVFDAALFGSIASITWTMFLGWIIFTSHLGYKNSFTKIFEWRGFLVSTKLSYGIYLVQFAVFHYNIGTTRNSVHFGIIKSMIDTSELISIVIAAAAMTLFFDLPFGNLKKLIFDTKKPQQQLHKDKESVRNGSHVDMNANIISNGKKIE